MWSIAQKRNNALNWIATTKYNKLSPNCGCKNLIHILLIISWIIQDNLYFCTIVYCINEYKQQTLTKLE